MVLTLTLPLIQGIVIPNIAVLLYQNRRDNVANYETSCGDKNTTAVYKAWQYGQNKCRGDIIDLDRKSVSFMHMFHACLNCVASFTISRCQWT